MNPRESRQIDWFSSRQIHGYRLKAKIFQRLCKSMLTIQSVEKSVKAYFMTAVL